MAITNPTLSENLDLSNPRLSDVPNSHASSAFHPSHLRHFAYTEAMKAWLKMVVIT